MSDALTKLADLQRKIEQGQEVFNALQRSGYGLAHSADLSLPADGSPEVPVEPSLQRNPSYSCSARKAWMDSDVLKPEPNTRRLKPAAELAVVAVALIALASFSLAVRTRLC